MPIGRHIVFVGANRESRAWPASRRPDPGRQLHSGEPGPDWPASCSSPPSAASIRPPRPAISCRHWPPSSSAPRSSCRPVQSDGDVPGYLLPGDRILGLQLLGYTGWVQDAFYGAGLVVAVTVASLVRNEPYRLSATNQSLEDTCDSSEHKPRADSNRRPARRRRRRTRRRRIPTRSAFRDDGERLPGSGKRSRQPGRRAALRRPAAAQAGRAVAMRDFMIFEEHVLPGGEAWDDPRSRRLVRAARSATSATRPPSAGRATRSRFGRLHQHGLRTRGRRLLGRPLARSPPSRATGYIAGFTVLSDWSAPTCSSVRWTEARPVQGKDFGSSLGRSS